MPRLTGDTRRRLRRALMLIEKKVKKMPKNKCHLYFQKYLFK